MTDVNASRGYSGLIAQGGEGEGMVGDSHRTSAEPLGSSQSSVQAVRTELTRVETQFVLCIRWVGLVKMRKRFHRTFDRVWLVRLFGNI